MTAERYEKETGDCAYDFTCLEYPSGNLKPKEAYLKWLEKEAESKEKAEQERDEARRQSVEFAKWIRESYPRYTNIIPLSLAQEAQKIIYKHKESV